jgi:hypothetical protein
LSGLILAIFGCTISATGMILACKRTHQKEDSFGMSIAFLYLALNKFLLYGAM